MKKTKTPYKIKRKVDKLLKKHESLFNLDLIEFSKSEPQKSASAFLNQEVDTTDSEKKTFINSESPKLRPMHREDTFGVQQKELCKKFIADLKNFNQLLNEWNHKEAWAKPRKSFLDLNDLNTNQLKFNSLENWRISSSHTTEIAFQVRYVLTNLQENPDPQTTSFEDLMRAISKSWPQGVLILTNYREQFNNLSPEEPKKLSPK